MEFAGLFPTGILAVDASRDTMDDTAMTISTTARHRLARITAPVSTASTGTSVSVPPAGPALTAHKILMIARRTLVTTTGRVETKRTISNVTAPTVGKGKSVCQEAVSVMASCVQMAVPVLNWRILITALVFLDTMGPTAI